MPRIKLFRSFSGILVIGAIVAHLVLTFVLFSSILVYVEKTYQDQFVDNVRSMVNMIALQSSQFLNNDKSSLTGFLDELLLNGNIVYVEIKVEDGTSYIANETENIDLPFKEDFRFSSNNDNTYFIAAPLSTSSSEFNANMEFGFDETLIQENIDTAYARGLYLAVGYFLLVIVLITIFVPKLTSSLKQLKIAARKISSGRGDVNLEISSKIEEFDSLIDSIKTMRASILQQKQAVEKKQKYISAIMNRMADAMITMDSRLNILFLNQSAENIFEYRTSELKGISFISLLSPPENNNKFSEDEINALENALSSEKHESSIECIGNKKNSGKFPIELFHSHFNHGGDTTIICNVHDLTDHKKHEQELTVAAESAELANKSKSDFLSSMSHELRTPLNAIIGYSEILIEESVEAGNSHQSSDLSKIRNSGKHLLSLINNVLDLSKIEAGKMELDNTNFFLPLVIKEVVHTIEPLVIKNKNVFNLIYDEAQLEMYADATKIKQTLINLIGNATKFTENGEIDLKVDYESINDIPSVIFKISDTGIGISEEDQENLFKEFSQANSKVTNKYGGSGLGLIISRTFCQMMGGDISLESQSGKGTTFTVVLPVTVTTSKTENELT